MIRKTNKLVNVCKIFNGNSINAKVKENLYTHIENGTPYIATKDISYSGQIDYQNGISIPKNALKNFKIAHPKTVFVCAEGGSAGRKIGIIDREVCFVNKLFALVASEIVLPKFIYYYTLGESFQIQFREALTGVIGGVSISKIKNFEINYPSIKEQQHIVARLEAAFAEIDKTIASVECNLKNTKSLFKVSLNEVFRIQTVDDSINKNIELDSVIETLTDYHANGSYQILKKNVTLKKEKDYAWMIRSTDFEKNFKNKLRYIDQNSYKFLAKSKIFGGELLLSKIGNAGKIYFVPELSEPASLAMNLFLIRLKNNLVINKYVFFYLQTDEGKKQILDRIKGATTQTITKNNVRTIIIPNCSLEKQRKIIKKIDDLQLLTNRNIDLQKKKLEKLNTLKKSMLNFLLAKNKKIAA